MSAVAGGRAAPARGRSGPLRHPNARIYFGGLAVSNVGTWLQLTAMSLLVYDLSGQVDRPRHHRRPAVPADAAPRGRGAGALSDRLDKRRMAIVTQASCCAVQASCSACVVLAELGPARARCVSGRAVDARASASIGCSPSMNAGPGAVGLRRDVRTELVEHAIPVMATAYATVAEHASVMTGARAIFGGRPLAALLSDDPSGIGVVLPAQRMASFGAVLLISSCSPFAHTLTGAAARSPHARDRRGRGVAAGASAVRSASSTATDGLQRRSS